MKYFCEKSSKKFCLFWNTFFSNSRKIIQCPKKLLTWLKKRFLRNEHPFIIFFQFSPLESSHYSYDASMMEKKNCCNMDSCSYRMEWEEFAILDLAADSRKKQKEMSRGSDWAKRVKILHHRLLDTQTLTPLQYIVTLSLERAISDAWKTLSGRF